MSPRGPAKGTGGGVSVANAIASWESPPPWIMALAEACDAPGSSQKTVGARINFAGSTISQVLANKYGGNLARVERAVTVALMQDTVVCPIVGEITGALCTRHQNRAAGKLNPTSSVRVRLYRSCRGACPHSRMHGGHDVEQ